MTDRAELAAWLRLAWAPGIGPAPARKLLAAFGLPQAVLAQPLRALENLLDKRQLQALQAEPAGLADLVERSWQWLHDGAADGVQHAIVTLGDPRYPPALLATEDPPLVLYLMGQLQALAPDAARRSVAIVGSRNPTPQGLVNARQFAQALADAGLTVVSGLALGVDAAAHEGALVAPGAPVCATLAVVGTGLDRVYPSQHRELAHRIAQRGVVASELPLGTPPMAENFPRRNRLIAGLSRATLVVEAALRSGSLITARLASEQGKDVLAIPGSIHSPQSRGCHALIKQGARLVETVQDVLDELGPLDPAGHTPAARKAAAPTATEPTGEAQDALLDDLGFDPVHLDALIARTGWDAARLQARLMLLELEGQVARLPGGLYQRTPKG